MSEKPIDMNDKVYKILIIDDEKDVLDALYLTLDRAEQFKSEIFLAQDSETALALMDKLEFDLVLSDYKMPNMNGIELLSKVMNKTPNQVRMLITGYSDINITKEAINKAQVHNYIEKPWNDNELIMTVYEALKRKAQRESDKITKVVKVDEALKLVKEFQDDPINFQLREQMHDQKLMFEFDSVIEFNKFSFKINKLKNTYIDDIHVFENKYITTVGIAPKSIEDVLLYKE